MRRGLLRLHWLDVLRHIYGHSAHGSATTVPGGWDAFLWRRDNRKGALLCQRTPDATLPQALSFIDSLGEGWPVLIELEACSFTDMERAGLVWDCDLPGHFIPTEPAHRFTGLCGYGVIQAGGPLCGKDPFAVQTAPMIGLVKAPDGFTLREVTDARTLADFAYVQDQAYRATYDWPKGCASLFYTDPASLIGPDSLGAVLYEGDMPVRTAALIHKRGIVAGVAGAAVPSIRGQHLGEPLIEHLRRRARELWGADVVHHITMPCAVPIAARLGLEQVTLYHRWRKA